MMSERKRKRGRPRTAPVISYGVERSMRNSIQRNIKKPKYLLDQEEESSQSRSSTPSRTLECRGLQPPVKNSRGYNHDFEDKNSEFHYGSDFEIDPCSENEAVDSDALSISDIGGALLSDDEGVLSDNDMNDCSERQGTPNNILLPAISCPIIPEAVWLQDRSVPQLTLPPSADDLFIPLSHLMPALGIYEVLRHFRTLVRLSPFRFEEFCGTLLNPKQTELLADIHIALLRALIREDESQSTHFGPMDHKDSINIMLYLLDPLTWPQVLYNYLESDFNTYRDIVKMMDKCCYPYTTLQNRLQVLRALTDSVLCVSGVREELISEGKLRYDDHCRSCHKTGDLLCCDSCTAVYHLDCLDGDVPAIPMDDWTCSVCIKNQVCGVTDCLSSPEQSGLLSRHEPLGYDRHGRKYWFLARRLIIESSTGSVWYYSTQCQVRAVLSLLEPADLEQDLVACITDQLPELERQLAVTERITHQNRGNTRAAITKNDEEIKQFVLNLQTKIKEEEEDVKSELDDGQICSGGLGVNATTELKVEPKAEDEGMYTESGSDSNGNTVKAEEKGSVEERHRKWDLWGYSIVGRPWMMSADKVEVVVKEKLEQLKKNDHEYRTGCECGENYVNQYSCNAMALNKLQHNEDRDKKRHLSHKFSVAANTEFKWTGTLYGSRTDMTECLVSCLQQLEQQVSSHLYHPHWAAMRKTWQTAVAASTTPRHFRRCMVWLIAAVKPAVFHAVWHEALGHSRLVRLTAIEREERRRQEKKDKKDAEIQQLDDIKNTLSVVFTKPIKHQLWKVKGEEYRLVCGDGWRWWSRCRRVKHVPASTVGLRAGPDKVVVAVNMAGGLRGLPVTPDVFTRLADKTPGLKSSLYSPQYKAKHNIDQPGDQQEKNEIIISNSGGESGTQKVLVVETPLEQFFEDGLVNVSRALLGRTRLVYPKVPVVSALLDGLLARRLAMPTSTNKNGLDENGDVDVEGVGAGTAEDGVGAGSQEAGAESKTNTIQEIPDSQRTAIHRLRPAGNLLKEIRTHKLRYEALDESVLYRCYSQSCGVGCYSPLCRTKAKTREKLINSVKNYTIVTSKASPYPQVGVNDIINFAEMNFSDNNGSSNSKSSDSNSSGGNSKSSNSSSSGGNKAGRKERSAVQSSATKASEQSNAAKNSGANGSTEISVRLEQDLDENSQSSVSLEHKFAIKGEGEKSKAAESCSGKVFLRKKPVPVKSKKTILRLPQVSTCRVGKDRYSKLVLAKWELKVLARRGCRHNVSGFNHQAKSNTSVWPYQCSRPVFRHTWLYKTAILNSLSAVALQLRIIWVCMRWDDMQEKGSSDGKRQITTETEIVQTEILKRKYSGRFTEKTEYLRRKVTIPFEVPKPVREFTPSQRSGLRKRRRALSPEDKRPEIVEEWVTEEQLQLWEIRLFGERLERAANQPKKPEPSSISASTAVKITMSGSTSGPGELKQRLEEQLKQQRAAYQQQQRDGSKTVLKISSISSNKPGTLVTAVKGQQLSTMAPTKKVMRTKDGRLISVQTVGTIQAANSVGNSTIFPMSSGGLPKVQIAPHTTNKVIRLQTVPANPRMILPRAPRPVIQVPGATSSPSIATPAIIKLPNQNIQILRTPDGQIQVKGLMEGQQMIQRPDGKFQLLNNVVNNSNKISIGAAASVQVTQQKAPLIKPMQQHQQQIVKVNGQQVLLRKEGLGTQIVSVGTSEALRSGVLQRNQQQQSNNSIAATVGAGPVRTVMSSFASSNRTVIGSIATGTVPTLNSDINNANSVTGAGQPVSSNTAPKTDGSSLTLRVQVRMTDQGPKTIIQGLQPSVGLTKDHIRAIQQQVRSMLAQYNLKVNQLSPIMTLTLNISGGASVQQVNTQLPVQATTNQSNDINNSILQQNNSTIPNLSNRVTLQSTGVRLPVIALRNNNNINAGESNTFIKTSSGTIIANNNSAASQIVEGGTKSIAPTKTSVSPKTLAAGGGGNQFELTNDFIQQTIQSALNRNDLSPDVEEKLVQLKKYTTDKIEDVPDATAVTGVPVSAVSNNKRTRDPSESGEVEGRSARQPKSKKARNSASQSNGNSSSSTAAVTAVPDTLSSPTHKTTPPSDRTTPNTKKTRKSATVSPADENTKKKNSGLSKIESQLFRHKELLKKDVLKKRAILEKDLQLQIHKELGIAKQQLQALEKKSATSSNKTESSSAKKRKRQEMDDGQCRVPGVASAAAISNSNPASAGAGYHQNNRTTSNNNQQPQQKKIASSSPSKNAGGTTTSKKNKNKNKKIVCICKTPFDDSKFYVGCDYCANWFHGDCVGITEALSRTMTEYVCDDCANAKSSMELYCFCKKPYDESQFYICCERCEDWYHGRCIGIMQGEADDIDDYICPKCDPKNVWNHPCQKTLTSKDYTELKKVAKTLVGHKNAWPFLDAVDVKEVPDYNKIVSQPMDLKTVERRVREHYYKCVATFIGDVMLLFDNCRLYNPTNSSFASCASTLESFFCAKVKQLKQKIAAHGAGHTKP